MLLNAGMTGTYSTGYRSYSDEMKRTRQRWNGFAMSTDSIFTIVIGLQSRTAQLAAQRAIRLVAECHLGRGL